MFTEAMTMIRFLALRSRATSYPPESVAKRSFQNDLGLAGCGLES
jgi:hypothetical protein